jgi:glycosyltransferase involved in cell wall biosynthesis
MVFGRVFGRFFVGPHLGLQNGDDTPDTSTLSELVETYDFWPEVVRQLPGRTKQLYTMFETSDVHPDVITNMKVFDRVLVPVQYLCDILVRHGVNAVSLNFYTSDLIRERHTVIPKTLDPARIIFLYVGTNDARKNLTTLTRAFARLGGSHVLIAKTNKSDGLAVSPNIKVITGRIENTKLAALYNMCDYVISATRGEGVGLPMLEADYFRKPIVAHDQGVFRDVRGLVSVPWHVVPSTEIPISYEGVPGFLHKVFWGTWWNVSEDELLGTLLKICYNKDGYGNRGDC